MKTAGLVTGACLIALCGCASEPLSEPVTRADSGAAAPVDLTQRPADADGRPTDWKKLQTWQALRGLTFTGDGVAVDEAASGEVEHARGQGASAASVSRSDELLAINARVRAMGAARDAILADHGNAEAYRALGRALRAKRKDARALDAFKTAAKLAPQSAPIRADLADAYNRVGQRDEARDAYREAVVLDPGDGHSLSRLAILEYYAGDDESAWRHLRDAQRLGADVPPQFVALLRERTPEP